MERISDFGDGRDREVEPELWAALSSLLQMMFGIYEVYSLLEPLFLCGVTKAPGNFQLDLMAPNPEHARACNGLFKQPLEVVFSTAFNKDCLVTFLSPESAHLFDRAIDITWDEALQEHPSVKAARAAMQKWLTNT